MPGTSSITGDESIVFCDNMSFDGTERGGKMTADGDLWIGSTVAPHVKKGTMTNGNNISWTKSSGGLKADLTGTTDHAIQLGNASGSLTSMPVGASNTVLQGNNLADPSFNTNLTLNDANSALTQGVISWSTSGLRIHNYGSDNIFFGQGAGNGTLTVGSATDNIGIGLNCLTALTTGSLNAAWGANCLPALTTGGSNLAIGVNAMRAAVGNSQNVALGVFSLKNATSGNNNVSLGYNALLNLVSGHDNTVIGQGAGTAYTGAESGNILLGSGVTGTLGESNVTRIGNISGTTPTGTLQMVVVNSTNQLGSQPITSAFAYTTVNHAQSPYTVLATDYFISVDTSGGTVVLNFPNAPTAKQTWIVKDRTGTASTNNISLTTPGGVVTFDGQTTYTLASNYSSVNILANSTPNYEIY